MYVRSGNRGPEPVLRGNLVSTNSRYLSCAQAMQNVAGMVRSQLESYKEMLDEGLISEDAHTKFYNSTIRFALKSLNQKGSQIGSSSTLDTLKEEPEIKEEKGLYERLQWEVVHQMEGKGKTFDVIKKTLLGMAAQGNDVDWLTDRPSHYVSKKFEAWRWKTADFLALRVKIEKPKNRNQI